MLTKSLSAGNAIANMLLGRLDFTRQNTAQIAKPIEVYLDYGALYVQDDFRITPKLTINAGLRYEIETGLDERNNNLTAGFDRAAASPLKAPGLDLKGGLVYAGVNGAPDTQTATFHKFAPRAGFAYAVNDKTTIRGGYGIFMRRRSSPSRSRGWARSASLRSRRWRRAQRSRILFPPA